MFRYWLRCLARGWGLLKQHRRPYRKRRSIPFVELLETRVCPALASPPGQLLFPGGSPIDLQARHLNADPFLDLVALTADGRLAVALNNGDNTWQSPQLFDLGHGPTYGLMLGRFDADPYMDLAVQTGDGVLLASGTGTGSFWNFRLISLGAPGSLASPVGGRIQLAKLLLPGDSAPSLVTVAPGTNELIVLRNDGNGGFTPTRLSSGGSTPVAVLAGDFVGGRLFDLAVGHRDGTVTFFKGCGDGSFLPRPDLAVGGLGAVTGMTALDIDGDGDTDLAVSCGAGVAVIENADMPNGPGPLLNGDFAAGLSGWTVTSGLVGGGGGFAQFRESTTLLSSLEQTFVVPAGATSLTFDLVALGLDPANGGLPDAFAVD